MKESFLLLGFLSLDSVLTKERNNKDVAPGSVSPGKLAGAYQHSKDISVCVRVCIILSVWCVQGRGHVQTPVHTHPGRWRMPGCPALLLLLQWDLVSYWTWSEAGGQQTEWSSSSHNTGVQALWAKSHFVPGCLGSSSDLDTCTAGAFTLWGVSLFPKSILLSIILQDSWTREIYRSKWLFILWLTILYNLNTAVFRDNMIYDLWLHYWRVFIWKHTLLEFW